MTKTNLKAISTFALYTGLVAWGWCVGCSTAGPSSQTSGGSTGGTSNTSLDSGVTPSLQADSGVTVPPPPPPPAPPADSGAPPHADAGGVDPDLACYGMASDGCYNCCVTNHPSGSTVYENAFFDCVCGPPVGTEGACQTQCAQTDCSETGDAGAVTGDPCDLCEQMSVGDAGLCASPVNTACGASPDCLAFADCQNQCP